MSMLSTISFSDYEIPDTIMCKYIYESICKSIENNSFKFLHTPDDALDEIHIFIDTMLILLSDTFDQTMMIQYIITHDDTQFVFSPGNVFTCKVAEKMNGMQQHPIVRINTTI